MQNIFNLEEIYLQIRAIIPLTNNIIPVVIFIQTDSTNFNKINIENNDLIQTYTSPLYANLNISNNIGFVSSNTTVYNYNVQNDVSGNDLKDASGNYLYHSFVQTVYRLPTGTIGIAHTPKLEHFDDYYDLPSNNTIHIAPIVFGTGMYLEKRGIVGIIASPISALKAVIIFIFNDLPISNICLTAKTPITTNQGLIHIDKINPEIHTIHYKKIVAVTKTITLDDYLVCFEKDSLGTNVPCEKTIISENHKLFYNGKMTKAIDFIDKFDNVKKIKYNGEILYNILMEESNKMMVNNLICETLDPINSISKLQLKLQELNIEEQKTIIKKYNDYVIKNKVYVIKSKVYVSKK
jgi:hypothetical protein